MEQHKYTYQSDFAKRFMAEGLKQGLRQLLGVQLEQRFGALPAEVQAQLDAADADTLSTWGRRVLTAASLADVFAANPG